jgi:hypothetical protein
MIGCARDAGIEVLGIQAWNPAELLVARDARIPLDDFAGEIVVRAPRATARTLWPSAKECCPLPRVPTAATLWVSARGLLSGPEDSARHAVRRRGDHRRETGAADEIGSREQGRVTVRTRAVGETEGTG